MRSDDKIDQNAPSLGRQSRPVFATFLLSFADMFSSTSEITEPIKAVQLKPGSSWDQQAESLMVWL